MPPVTGHYRIETAISRNLRMPVTCELRFHLLRDGCAYVTGSPRWGPMARRIAFDIRAHDPVKFGDPGI